MLKTAKIIHFPKFSLGAWIKNLGPKSKGASMPQQSTLWNLSKVQEVQPFACLVLGIIIWEREEILGKLKCKLGKGISITLHVKVNASIYLWTSGSICRISTPLRFWTRPDQSQVAASASKRRSWVQKLYNWEYSSQRIFGCWPWHLDSTEIQNAMTTLHYNHGILRFSAIKIGWLQYKHYG